MISNTYMLRYCKVHTKTVLNMMRGVFLTDYALLSSTRFVAFM